MAQKNGNDVFWRVLASNGYDMASGDQYAVINYTTSSTATTFTVTITSIQMVVPYSWPPAMPVGGPDPSTFNYTVYGKLSSSGYTDLSYSGTHRNTNYTHTFATSITRTYTRTTSPQTKTIKLQTWIPTPYYSQYSPTEISTAQLDITVPALDSYAVSFNANGGTGAPSNQAKYYGVDLTLTSATPTFEGYTFKGWATSTADAASPAGKTIYAAGSTYSNDAAITLYAVWELAYQLPTITNMSVERCDQDGTDNDEGAYAKVSFNWSIFSSSAARYYGGSTPGPYNGNSATCQISVGSETATPTLTGTSGSESVIVGSGAFDVDTQYAASVSITDTQTLVSPHTTTVNDVLPSSKFPMDFNSTATSVGFFMPAPDNGEGMYIRGDISFDLPDYQDSSSDDYALYNAITGKSWNDVISQTEIVSLKKLLVHIIDSL